MPKIITLSEIKQALKGLNLIGIIQEGFVAYSQGNVVVPPVGEMLFDKPRGDVHIKYGYIKGDDYYVIKIASGFYENPKIGLPCSNGLMLLFSQKTGQLIAILLDDAYLTQIRTAAAGAIAAKYLAPKKIERIGIIGAGRQGRLQLEYLKSITETKEVIVWGINQQELDAYKKDMEPLGYNIWTTLNTNDVASSCNLIVTCTPSASPLLWAGQVKQGTHITAMGADTPTKQELDPGILKKADRVVVDSISQCVVRGETFHALKAGLIRKEDLIELGTMITDETHHRSSDHEITVADLTGVAVQDIQIAKAVWERLG